MVVGYHVEELSLLNVDDTDIGDNKHFKEEWVPVVMNIFIPPFTLITGTAIGAAIASEPVGEWVSYSWALLPLALTITTIPAHIYVGDNIAKTIIIPFGKLLWTGVFLTASAFCALQGLCALEGNEDCAPPEETCWAYYMIGAVPTFIIYIWETFDAVSKVKEYNRKLRESRLYITPFALKNGFGMGIGLKF